MAQNGVGERQKNFTTTIKSKLLHDICVYEMRISQCYAYIAFYWLFLRAQESLYKTACTAHFHGLAVA